MNFLSPEILRDAATIGVLVVLEGLLSADNALVLALLVRHLPAAQQKKALRYGILGAFAFRAIAVFLAAYLISLWYLKALGAVYLCYLCGKHLYARYLAGGKAEHGVAAVCGSYGFWRTVLAVELTDVAFSIDSILAAVGMSPKKWIVYTGGVLGIITMRFVAGLFIKMLERFPALETSAYLMVGWIGVKLGVETYSYLTHPEGTLESLPAWLFWGVLALLFMGGLMLKRRGDGARTV